MSLPEPPLPVPDERSAPFFQGAREGRLRLQRCPACDTWHFPVRSRCAACGSLGLAWADAGGRGTLYSHGVLHRSGHPGLAARLPIRLAVVDLEEGVRMSGRFASEAEGEARCGAPVEVVFERLSDELALPVFRMATPPQES